MRAFFLFVCDSNCHQKRKGSTTPNRHGVAAFDFSTVSGYDHFVFGRTHVRHETLDLLITDDPDLVSVAVVAPIGNSDQSSLSAVISVALVIPNLSFSVNIFRKHQVN